MIPPNILLILGTGLDVPKDWASKVPEDAKPLDTWIDPPYLGEIRFNTDTLKCYIYTENGWKEVF